MVTGWVIGGSNVDDFPVESAWQRGEALKSDIKAEGIKNLGRVVFDDYVVDVNLCHLAGFFKSIISIIKASFRLKSLIKVYFNISFYESVNGLPFLIRYIYSR